MHTRNLYITDTHNLSFIRKFAIDNLVAIEITTIINISFSAKFYQNKFEENLLTYIKEESDKFKNKYNININLTELLAFNLYKKIEKRGCYCIYKQSSLKQFIIKQA